MSFEYAIALDSVEFRTLAEMNLLNSNPIKGRKVACAVVFYQLSSIRAGPNPGEGSNHFSDLVLLANL